VAYVGTTLSESGEHSILQYAYLHFGSCCSKHYFQGMITLKNKGLRMELQKILGLVSWA
jgi:hypothetical protein